MSRQERKAGRVRQRAVDDGSCGETASPAYRAVVGLVLALPVFLALRRVGSPDVGFHLKAGEYVLSGRGWPRTDPFTYTVTDHAYIDTSWGYQVILATLQKIAGAPGMVLFHAGLVAVIFALLFLTIRLVKADPHATVVFLLLGGLAAEMRYEVRPELLSYAFLALVLYLLQRHAEGRASPLWALPLIFLAWCNCHSLFILGWAALACFLVGLALRDRGPDRRLAGWTAASVAVCLINPYGYKALVFPFTLATRLAEDNVFARSIGEFADPFALGLSQQTPFYPWVPIWAFRLLVVLVTVSLVPLLFRQRRYWCVLLAIPFLYLSFKMVRNIPLVVVACLPGVAWAFPLGTLFERPRWSETARRRGKQALLFAVGIAVVVVGVRVATGAYYVSSRRTERFGLGWSRLTQPIDAVRYGDSAGLKGPVLNHLNFGGYLMWARPEPVFIDGRLEVIGERFYEEYVRALSSRERLEGCVARYGIRWTIFPYSINRQLLRRLSTDPEWRLAYFDHLAAVFVRNEPGAAALVDPALAAVPTPAAEVELDSLPGLGGGPRPGRVRRWLAGLVRRQDFPTDAFNRAIFHFGVRDYPRAAHGFAEAIRESDGAFPEIYNNLGLVLAAMGRPEDARRCHLLVLESHPGDPLARKQLTRLEAR